MNEWLRKLLFLPPQASTVAREIDGLHYLVISVTMLGAAVVTVMSGYYLIRYRRRPGPLAEHRRAVGRSIPIWVEGGLIVGILSLFVLFWHIGVRQYVHLRVAPPRSMDVYVTGKQWMWLFAYPNGRSSVAHLYVPAHRPIRLLLSSRDVIHSFYVPEFRIKQDAVPGRLTTVWFEAKRPGSYQVLCTEYCGPGHSTMRGTVIALSPADYARWLDEGAEELRAGVTPQAYEAPEIVGEDEPEEKPLSMIEQGQGVASRYGCLRCHTLDGSAHIGPTWLGLYMSRVPVEGGGSVLVDEAYITQSMMDPLARVHRGFPPVMPSYLGQLAPAEVAALVEYIRSLRNPAPSEVIDVPLADGGTEAHVVVPEEPVVGQNLPRSRGAPELLP